ncbi:MAG: hypothetical protein QXZ23_10955 [Saccharolobus sp.]
MFRRGRTKKENRGEEEKNRGTEEKNRRDEKRSRENIQPTERGYEEECSELLRQLLRLSSTEASLTFELYQLLEEARIETIRLGGLIASCRLQNPKLADQLYNEFEKLFTKYVKK